MEPKEPLAVDPTVIAGGDASDASSSDSIESHSEPTSTDTTDDEDDSQTVREDTTHETDDNPEESGSANIHSPVDEDTTSEKSEDEDWDEWYREQPKKTNVKWSNFESFKNRFARDEGFDIIEVLAGHPDHMSKEISQERLKRRRKKQTASRGKHQNETEHKFIHRVRIQSPAILHVLCRLTAQDDWSIDESRTFLRPFQTFFYCFPLAKQVLEILERRASEKQSHELDVLYPGPLPRRGTAAVATDPGGDLQHKLSMPSDVDLEEIVFAIPDLKSGVEHVKLYLDFVEEHIMPMWAEAAGTTKQKVRFSDLPMYFRPGDILYEPQKTDEDKEKAGKAGSDNAKTGSLAVFQNYWKLCYANVEEFDADPPNDIGSEVKKRELTLHSFHIDFDGDRYGPVDSKATIMGYEGEKDIRSQFMYPLRFHTDSADTRSDLIKRAEKFLFYVKERHLYYDGWTLIHNTYSADAGKDDKKQGVEHIEGEIIVDFKEGFQSDAEFSKPVLDLPTEPKGRSTSGTDYTEDIRWWSDRTRSKQLGYLHETVQRSERFDVLQNIRMKQKDRVLSAYEEKDRATDFDTDHLLLFPQRLIAYSFRARKFFVANIDSISKISAPKNSFRDLKIEAEHKRILKSLVGNHFQKQDIRRENKDAILDQDFIRGKGSGLVILLHGVPGVGKTTTAEAVALNSSKPLFALTSGDLGSTPRDVEKALRETFRLATLWDCVLLLDEADLFLAKRDVGDMERNSLVSVFLRVLDYYDGVLFLTTNRVGTVDEAFRSRIHLTLYYPPLKKRQAIEIFKVNIRRVQEIEESKAALNESRQDASLKIAPIEIDVQSILKFAIYHWDNTPRSRRWNGRQIRNAFQVAYSLVHFNRLNPATSQYDDYEEYDDNEEAYDEDEEDDQEAGAKSKETDVPAVNTPGHQQENRGKLDRSQFEIVAQSIRRFDDYLEFTRGRDADYAKNKNLRRDDFSEDEYEDKSPRGGGRFRDARPSRSAPRRGNDRSPAPPGLLAPSADRGEKLRRDATSERREIPRGDRRTPEPDDFEEDFVEEAPVNRRRRGGASFGGGPRNRQRGYDDYDEYSDHGRYR